MWGPGWKAAVDATFFIKCQFRCAEPSLVGIGLDEQTQRILKFVPCSNERVI